MKLRTLILLMTLAIVTGSFSAEKVVVWSSLPDTKALLVKKNIKLNTKPLQIKNKVEIFPEQTCQSVEGVGAALTHSSAYVFHHNLTAEDGFVVQVLFTPEGIGIKYTRLCIGASDFSF
jgi:hypothetical protein